MDNSILKEMEEFLEMCKGVEKKPIVMDDYDAGRVSMVRSIISDLEKIKRRNKTWKNYPAIKLVVERMAQRE